MDYQLLSEDENSYHVKHPKLGNIRIAKQAVSDVVHQKIKSFYKGGEAESSLADLGSTGEDDPLLKPEVKEQKEDGLLSQVGEGLKQSRDTILTSLPESPNLVDDTSQPPMSSYYDQKPYQAQQQSPEHPNLIASNGPIPVNALNQTPVPVGGEATPQSAPSAGGNNVQVPANPKQDMLSQMNDIARQEQDAVGAKAKAESDMYKQQADLASQQQLEQQQAYNNHVAIMARNERELDQVRDSVMNSKIDPNRLWNQASTGGKIAASIGIILGGIGAGLTGGPNQALAMVNRLVDQDIDAQKADMGKKQTLYSMNMKKYQNEQAAYMATKLQLASVYQGQLAQTTAKAQSQIAIQNGTIAQQEINKAMLPMKQELARWQMGQNFLYGQGGGGQDQNTARAAEMLLPKEDKERLIYVPGQNGNRRPVLAPDKGEADKFRESEISADEMQSAIKDAKQHVLDNGATFGSPIYDSEAQKLGSQKLKHITMMMSKLHGLNRLSDVDLHEFQGMLPKDLGTIRTSTTLAQLSQLEKMLNDKRNATYKQYTPGYNPGKFSSQETQPVRSGR